MSWVAVAIGGGALASAGGSMYSASKGKKFNPEDLLVYKELPGYTEADQARKKWWSQLQEWGKEPGFGAISPEWDDIWNRAKNKLTQYYWGGTMDSGLAGKVRASAARRNMSQSPALENQLMAMGMQEGQDLRDLAGQQAEKEAQFAETGRQNWLTSLMNLTQLKPSYVTGTGTSTPEYNFGGMISDLGGGVVDIFGQYAQQEYLTKQREQSQNWLQDLLKNSGGSGGNSLVSDLGSAKPLGFGGISLLNKSDYPNLFDSNLLAGGK